MQVTDALAKVDTMRAKQGTDSDTKVQAAQAKATQLQQQLTGGWPRGRATGACGATAEPRLRGQRQAGDGRLPAVPSGLPLPLNACFACMLLPSLQPLPRSTRLTRRRSTSAWCR